MPAQVTIQTIECTALDYLIGLLAMSFNVSAAVALAAA